MTDESSRRQESSGPPALRPSPLPGRPEQATLADILERVLDKGIVIAGDIQINLLDIELLTIKLRLLIASVDRAQEMGINWWESDPALSKPSRPGDEDDDEEGGRKQLEQQNQELRERVERLERQIQGGQSGEQEAASRQAGGGSE